MFRRTGRIQMYFFLHANVNHYYKHVYYAKSCTFPYACRTFFFYRFHKYIRLSLEGNEDKIISIHFCLGNNTVSTKYPPQCNIYING